MDNGFGVDRNKNTPKTIYKVTLQSHGYQDGKQREIGFEWQKKLWTNDLKVQMKKKFKKKKIIIIPNEGFFFFF